MSVRVLIGELQVGVGQAELDDQEQVLHGIYIFFRRARWELSALLHV
jgi:hypothetical protein